MTNLVTKSDNPRRGNIEGVHSRYVKLHDGFWGRRQKIHQAVTIPHVLNCLEEHGHVTNFDKAAGHFEGDLRGHGAFDSDLHKALEGAMYCLQNEDDPQLLSRVESILDRILAAQQEDGFLIAYHIVKDIHKAWDDLRLGHQMYNAGHFFEMAIEHKRLTGNTRVLDAARRFADHIDERFGPEKRYDVDGHQEVELALVKLYQATGEQRYLDLAGFFLDERGRAHGTARAPFDAGKQVEPVRPQGKLEGDERREFWHSQLRFRNGRMQDHKPLVDQHEAIGHAVRAGYMYAAMADMVHLNNTPGYEAALDNIWDDVVSRKLYVTGGIGTGQYDDEGFGDPYVLPNETAYCESCAAIANILWQHRMNLIKGHTTYIDVMELSLYNGAISGIALTGDAFSYENHLCSHEGESRSSWIGIACCPTNLARMIPQVGGWAYAVAERKVMVNLYVSGDAEIEIAEDLSVMLSQKTDYPWDGDVELTINPNQDAVFALCLRIPGWALGQVVPSDLYIASCPDQQAIMLCVNGERVDVSPRADGYVHMQRHWKAGDTVKLSFPMPVQRIHAHPKVLANTGKVALMRGPIVYCLEGVDNPEHDIFTLALPRGSVLHAQHRPDLLDGVTVLIGNAIDVSQNPISLTAIPCYATANREKSPMTVWINEA